MSSPVPGSGGEVLVLTRVIPPQSQSGPQEEPLIYIQAKLVGLGTVQIMIGLMMFSYGIVTVIPAEDLGVTSLSAISGIFVWGAAIIIAAGSLTVAAVKSPTRRLMKATFGFNVLAFVASAAAGLIYPPEGSYLRCYNATSGDCDLYKTRATGFSIVMAIFMLLELLISVRLAIFTYIPACYHDDQQEEVYVIPGNILLAPHAPPPYDVPPVSMAHPTPQMMVSSGPEGYINPGLTDPPAYTRS